nr:MAG TPA: hypothetical protein [Caudoviricetes sp.]
MTIDEAIKKCEYGVCFSDEEYDELQVMLEELKELRRFKDEVEDKLLKVIEDNIEYYHNHPHLIITVGDAMSAFIDLRDFVVRLEKAGGNS